MNDETIAGSGQQAAGSDEQAVKADDAVTASDATQPQSDDSATPRLRDSTTDKADEYLSGWKQALADYANLKREMETGKVEMMKFASVGLIMEILPVYDSLKQAATHLPPPDADVAKFQQWATGIQQVNQQFESVLKKVGVECIDAAGVPFDPNIHDAVMMRPAEEGKPSNQVAQVLQPGYKLHEKVIRAAKVAVSE